MQSGKRIKSVYILFKNNETFQTMSGSGVHSIPIPVSSRQSPGDDSMSSSSSSSPSSLSSSPGGSKIVYERSFLINMRNSPLARTPPRNLPNIPRSWSSTNRPVSGA